MKTPEARDYEIADELTRRAQAAGMSPIVLAAMVIRQGMLVRSSHLEFPDGWQRHDAFPLS